MVQGNIRRISPARVNKDMLFCPAHKLDHPQVEKNQPIKKKSSFVVVDDPSDSDSGTSLNYEHYPPPPQQPPSILSKTEIPLKAGYPDLSSRPIKQSFDVDNAINKLQENNRKRPADPFEHRASYKRAAIKEVFF